MRLLCLAALALVLPAAAAPAGNRVLVFGGQEGVKALDEVVAISTAGTAAPDDRGMWPAVAAVAFLAPAAVVLFIIGRRR